MVLDINGDDVRLVLVAVKEVNGDSPGPLKLIALITSSLRIRSFL